MTDMKYSRLVNIVIDNHFNMNDTKVGRDIFEDVSDIDYDEREFSDFIRKSYAYLKRWTRTKRSDSDIFSEYICIYLYYLASKRPEELQNVWQHSSGILKNIYTDVGVTL